MKRKDITCEEIVFIKAKGVLTKLQFNGLTYNVKLSVHCKTVVEAERLSVKCFRSCLIILFNNPKKLNKRQ